jgi:hypothetical protein
MVLPSSANLTVARSLKPRLLCHITRLSPPVQDRVPLRVSAGSLVTMVPSLDGAGSVTRRAAFWLKARVQKIKGASQDRRVKKGACGRVT